MVLNHDTFSGNPTSDLPVFKDFVYRIRGRPSMRVRVDGPCIPYLTSLAKLAFPGQEWIVQRLLLDRPYARAGLPPVAANRLNRHTFRVIAPAAASGLRGHYLALASLSANIAVGLSGSKYGDTFAYTVQEQGGAVKTDISTLMVTKSSHFNCADFRRWQMLEKFRDGKDISDCISYSCHPGEWPKHFDVQLVKRSYSPASQWGGESWVGDTGKLRHEALFMPGLKFRSQDYNYILYLVLRAAYANLRFELKDQNEFVVDLLMPIGAAAGKVTSKVMLYVTADNVVHLRPAEKSLPGRSHTLSRPYRIGECDLDLL